MEIKNNPSTHPSFDLNPKPLSSNSLSLHSDDHSVEDSKMGVPLFASTLNAADIHSDEAAAMKLQKSYRGYRTRRLLADSAVDADKLWWQAIEFARLNHSTISFFNFQEQESTTSRWNRISSKASKVGKGLSLDSRSNILAFELWVEAIDPRHRYGRSLNLYYKEWCKTDVRQPFFYWLDIGDGKQVDLIECPRSKLHQQSIEYLGPKEREQYEYIIVEGKIMHRQTQVLLDTNNGATWIFVTTPSNRLYAGEKKRQKFHHSSFVAGGATLAAGKFDVENGTLKTVSPYSGHYRPTDETLSSFLSLLKENGVDLDTIKIGKAFEYSDTKEDKHTTNGFGLGIPISSDTMKSETHDNEKKVDETADREEGELHSPNSDVPKNEILESRKNTF